MGAVTKSFIGKGTIYIREKGAASGLISLGNCSTLELAVEEDTQEQQDYEEAGGAVIDSVSRITGITSSITALSISGDNIALAMRGLATIEPAAAVTDETATAYHDGFIRFDKLLDKSSSVAVRIASDDTVLVIDTDYVIKNSGIKILESPATVALVDGTPIEIDYMSKAAVNIEPVTATGIEHELVFDGLNEADSGAPVSIKFHRVKFNPTQALALIGDEFAEMPLTLALLKDQSISATGVSAFFQIKQSQ